MSQTSRISKNNTVVLREKGVTTVILHNTPVVKIDENKKTVTYDNGGWITVTTANRMNQASNELGLAYRVGRCKGVMSARNCETGEEFTFTSRELVLPLLYA